MMNPLDFLEPEDMLQFFHRKKTEMSCMDNPRTFLNQLRDHNLIAEDTYRNISHMRSKDKIRKALYDVLDWLERERPQYIKNFWTCVFEEIILNNYPTLRLLRNSLMDGSYHSGTQLPKRMQKEETAKGRKKEGDNKEVNSVKKKRKLRNKSMSDDEEEQAGPSSQLTRSQTKKSKKVYFYSPLKKGDRSNIWTWPLFKSQLPVTCGKQEGILSRGRLAKGEKCIAVKRRWFTPTEFEKFAGKESYKNWKLSIRCMGTPLGQLIQEGHLKPVSYKRGCKKAKKSLFPPNHCITVTDGEEDEDENEESDWVSSSSRESSTVDTDEEEETEEQTKQQREASNDCGKKVFNVTCGALAGTLHEKRFASGTHGKSIRTETSWMTPMEFMREAACQTNASWRKEIKYEEKPLSVLTEANILRIHSLLCTCRLCKPDCKDLEDQKNDDECCICKSEEEEELVVCDHCPRSFHQNCHLPNIDDAILGDGGLWMCTFCVFRSNRECYYLDEVTREVAMARQISQHMLECQYLLLCLRTTDKEQAFATNPNLYLEGYSTMIKTPMWLGNVADKLQTQLYRTVGEFVSDVELIFTNCASYNRENAEFLAMGNRLKKLFDAEFKNVFNIRE